MIRQYEKCPECERVFDLFDEDDAEEAAYGHDCEPLLSDDTGEWFTDHDAQRDAEREAFNAALASGDPDRIDRARDEILMAVHTRIMDDDPNYAAAGYAPGG